MSITFLIIANIILIILIFFLINFKWCVKTIREICHSGNEGGYTKFIQTIIVMVLILIFIGIIIYYIIDKQKVDRIDIVLTVIVGWLGAIIGRFFGERSMEQFEQKRYIKKIDLFMKDFVDFVDTKLKKP